MGHPFASSSIGKLLVLLLALHSFSQARERMHTTNLQNHHWHHGLNAGMGLSINGNDAALIRKYCTFFLPNIVAHELGSRPNWYAITFGDPFGDPFDLGEDVESTIEWSNIRYEITDVEYDQVTFSLDEWEGHGLFVFDFPAFKDFELRAHQTFYAWWFPDWLLNQETEI